MGKEDGQRAYPSSIGKEKKGSIFTRKQMDGMFLEEHGACGSCGHCFSQMGLHVFIIKRVMRTGEMSNTY